MCQTLCEVLGIIGENTVLSLCWGDDKQTSQHREQHNPICALMGEIQTKGRFQRVAHKDGEQELDYIFIKLVASNIN